MTSYNKEKKKLKYEIKNLGERYEESLVLDKIAEELEKIKKGYIVAKKNLQFPTIAPKKISALKDERIYRFEPAIQRLEREFEKRGIKEIDSGIFEQPEETIRISEIEVKHLADSLKKLKQEVSKIIVGQERIVDGLIRGLICNGHVLLEGIPGIAKTLAIRALGKASGCSVNRVQFTVDLLPTDIIGITSYTPEKGFKTIKGPVFTNFLIADEINRSPPKVQSALIQAMQEGQVTIGKIDYLLPEPFFVMATKNPLESVGVYPLPEAQVDRFLFKLTMGYPEENEEKIIMEKNISLKKFEDFNIRPVISPQDILDMQNSVKKVYLDSRIKSYIIDIVKKTRNKDFADSDCIQYGASPRASIAMFIASKAKALMDGRNFVLPEDVKEIVFDVLRHRLILSYKATIKGITPDDIIKNVLKEVSLV